jgi:hypothetical protein
MLSHSPSARGLRIACFAAARYRPIPANAATVARFADHHVTTSAWSRSHHGHHHHHHHHHYSRSRLFLRRPQARPQIRVCMQVHGQVHTRGKKTKTTVKLDELPQGVILVEPLPVEEDGPAYPTVVLQARRNMQKFDGCVLLTRVGGFYELYFEHADEYGPLLNLKVAQKKTAAGPVPMVNSSSLFLPYIRLLLGVL